MEWKKNNTFGMTAFSSYGFFWLILVALIVMPKLGLGEGYFKNGDDLLSLLMGSFHTADVRRYI